jgi:hypothetical protein
VKFIYTCGGLSDVIWFQQLAPCVCSRYDDGMSSEYKPHITDRIARRLLFGRDAGSEPSLLATWSGRDLTFDLRAQDELVQHVRRLLGFSVPGEALRHACCPLLSSQIDRGKLAFWCWHMAANREALMAGREFLSMSTVWGARWAPVEIVHVKPGRSFRDRAGFILTFRVVDGPLCPLHFEHWFPLRFLWVLARELGLSTWRSVRSSYAGKPLQLVGMRLTVQLKSRDPHEREPTESITFERYRGEPFRAYNRRLACARQKPCPLGSPGPCHICSAGPDGCPAGRSGSQRRACRPVSLQRLGCLQCRKDTWHDAGTCMNCRRDNPPYPNTTAYTDRIPPTMLAL